MSVVNLFDVEFTEPELSELLQQVHEDHPRFNRVAVRTSTVHRLRYTLTKRNRTLSRGVIEAAKAAVWKLEAMTIDE